MGGARRQPQGRGGLSLREGAGEVVLRWGARVRDWPVRFSTSVYILSNVTANPPSPPEGEALGVAPPRTARGTPPCAVLPSTRRSGLVGACRAARLGRPGVPVLPLGCVQNPAVGGALASRSDDTVFVRTWCFRGPCFPPLPPPPPPVAGPSPSAALILAIGPAKKFVWFRFSVRWL